MTALALTGQSQSGKTTNMISLVMRMLGKILQVVIDPQRHCRI